MKILVESKIGKKGIKTFKNKAEAKKWVMEHFSKIKSTKIMEADNSSAMKALDALDVALTAVHNFWKEMQDVNRSSAREVDGAFNHITAAVNIIHKFSGLKG